MLRPIGHLTPMPSRCLVLEGTEQWDKGEQPGWEVFSSSRRKEKLLGGAWRWRCPGGVGGRVWGPASVPATYSSVPCFLPVAAGGTPCCSLPAHVLETACAQPSLGLRAGPWNLTVCLNPSLLLPILCPGHSRCFGFLSGKLACWKIVQDPA